MTVRKINSSDDAVVTSSDIQVKYEQLYKFLMEFLWEFNVVQDLANLEMAIFKRFPDKEEMENCLRRLNQSISYTYNELSEDDEVEFKDAFEALETAIDNYDEEKTGCELYAVEEVINTPKDILAKDEMDMPNGKKKFKFGEIKKLTKEERELQEEAARTLTNPFENEETAE
jgi:hypothetical protein